MPATCAASTFAPLISRTPLSSSGHFRACQLLFHLFNLMLQRALLFRQFFLRLLGCRCFLLELFQDRVAGDGFDAADSG